MRGFTQAKDEYDNECCGTCVYHEYENIDNGWVCVNPASLYCTEWTEYEDYCTEYVRRK